MGVASKEELVSGIKTLHAHANLLYILETFQNYELPDEVLQVKMSGECRMHVPIVYNYSAVFFKLSGESKDTVVECFIAEMKGLQDIHSKYKTPSFKDSDTISGL